jgi:hypothetical protein
MRVSIASEIKLNARSVPLAREQQARRGAVGIGVAFVLFG